MFYAITIENPLIIEGRGGVDNTEELEGILSQLGRGKGLFSISSGVSAKARVQKILAEQEIEATTTKNQYKQQDQQAREISISSGASAKARVKEILERQEIEARENIATQTPESKGYKPQPNERTTAEGTGKASESYLTPEMEQKILGGERIPGKNGLRGGHSPNVVNDANPNYAVEVLRENPDGTKFVQFYHQFPDGTLAKLKKAQYFLIHGVIRKL
ncbi:hypothetical protein ACFQY3_24540 [Paenibacillus farraposensis]|uniref:hypothetical protein n=1 Tax=Paenibacillus farraposensis TaxID=2807095 RepID=UPI0036224C29